MHCGNHGMLVMVQAIHECMLLLVLLLLLLEVVVVVPRSVMAWEWVSMVQSKRGHMACLLVHMSRMDMA